MTDPPTVGAAARVGDSGIGPLGAFVVEGLAA